MSGPILAARLRAATQPMHRLAERSGIMRSLLRGDIDAAAYALLLRNLHALYNALECALDWHIDSPLVAPVRMPALYRTQPLAADLAHLHGPGWKALPLTEAMDGYVARIDHLCAQRPSALAAHAYVRYMGDLSGGQMLRDVVARALALPDDRGTAFYRFDEAGDAQALKALFRRALDSLPIDEGGAQAIVAEAIDAFERHVGLFEQLDSVPAQGAGFESAA